MQAVRLTVLLLISIFAFTLLQGCATNPVTGDQDFVLMSESEEISLGAKYNEQILREMSVYPDPELAAYVDQVGQRIAKVSHRPQLNYHFTVIDTPTVNAFALPGGYIYITRGILAYLNSEAELAAVLGHEIGHVTARHSVRQQSAATATGIAGTVLGAATGVPGSQDLFSVFGKAMLSGYGREQELESDRLGAQYLARSGYDPQAMLEVIGVLKNQEQFEQQRAREEKREARAYHGVFATHPDNDKRLQEVIAEADRLKTTANVRVGRKADNQKLFDDKFRDVARSYHHLSAKEKKLATGLRLAVTKTRADINFRLLAKISPIPRYAESELRLLNDLYPTGEPEIGQPLKIVQ